MQVVGALYNPRGRPSYYSHLRLIAFQTAFWLLTAKYNSVNEICLIYIGPEIDVKEFRKTYFYVYVYILMQIQKTIKKTARREQLMREEAEQKRL